MTKPGQARTLAALLQRLDDDGEAPDVIVTGPARQAAQAAGLPTADVDVENRAGVLRFLDEYGPELLIWMCQTLTTPALTEAERRAIPSFLVDAGAGGRLPQGGWRPGRLRTRLAGFAHVLAISDSAATRLIRAGARPEATEVLGRFADTPPPPRCDAADLSAMTDLLSGRPCWLAAGVPAREVDAVLEAHAKASRRSHRLLLILAPEDPQDTRIDRALDASAFQVAREAQGDDPAELHQVLLTDGCDDLGLWLRLSPVTYMGGTFTGRGGRLSPLAPAALGSAVIHGRNLPEAAEGYEALHTARASRVLASSTHLGQAVEDLIAPDAAADQASAGWTAVTAGAQAINRLGDLIKAQRDAT